MVKSFIPEYKPSGVYANMPIQMTFNMPLTNDDGTPASVSFDNISIYSGKDKINSCFYEPELKNNNTLVQVIPNANALISYMNSKNTRTMDITVRIEADKLSITKNGFECNYYDKGNTVFNYKAIAFSETQSPDQIGELILSKKELTAQNVGSLTIEGEIQKEGTPETSFNSLDIVKERRVKDYVYLYGKFFDADSGMQGIKITETMLNDKEGTVQSSDPIETIVDKNYLSLLTEDENTLEYIYRYKLKSADGCIKLTVNGVDYCGNLSNSVNYKLIKDTYIGIDKIYVYNCLFKHICPYEYYWFDGNENTLLADVNHVKILIESPLTNTKTDSYKYRYSLYQRSQFKQKLVYGSYSMDTSELTIECEYMSKDGPVKVPMTPKTDSTNTKYFDIALNVNSVAGLKFKIHISDDIGNHEEKEFQFPGGIDTIKNIETNKLHGNLKIYGSRVYFESSAPWTGAIGFTTDNSQCASGCNSSADMFYSELLGYSSDSYVFKLDAFTNKIVLINNITNSYVENSNYAYTGCDLLGPLQTINISNSVNVESITETNTDKLNLLAPVNTTFIKGEPGKGNVYVTLEFNPDVWKYWNEIQFNSSYDNSNHTSGPLQIVRKGTKFYSFEDPRAQQYKTGYTLKMTGFVVNMQTQDGSITSLTSKSGTKNYKTPNLPASCYNIAPTIYTPGVHYQFDENGKLIVGAVFVTLADSTQQIEKVIYWGPDGQQHINDYIKFQKEGYYQYLVYYYNAENFLENGDLTFVVEDQNGNVSNEKVLKKPTIPYVSGLNSATQVKFSEKIDSGAPSYTLYYSSYGENGFSSQKGYTISPPATTMNITDLPSNKYIRFYVTRRWDTSSEDLVSPYSYLYWSTVSGTHFGYMFDDNRGISLYSDLPVLVHTVITRRPLADCENWTIEQWENDYHKIRNDVVINFSSTDQTIKRYHIDTSDLTVGDNYVVIAHFADGHTDMSAVRHFE